MATIDQINQVIDAMKSRILAQKSTIGNITDVYERDEFPAEALQAGRIPAMYIIPVVESKDTIDMSMGSPRIMKHTFPVTLVAYYVMEDVETALRTVREYGYNTIDIFKSSQNFAGGVVYNAEIEFGYSTVVDYIVHDFIINLYVERYVNLET